MSFDDSEIAEPCESRLRSRSVDLLRVTVGCRADGRARVDAVAVTVRCHGSRLLFPRSRGSHLGGRISECERPFVTLGESVVEDGHGALFDQLASLK